MARLRSKSPRSAEAIVHDEVEAVVVGAGWCGGILAAELTRAGVGVVCLERGPAIEPLPGIRAGGRDEMDRRHFRRMQDTRRETWTMRRHSREPALPFRYAGAFTPGSGVGGSSVLYGGHAHRLQPWEFTPRSASVERYGSGALPAGAALQDWGISYEELAPCYDRFEVMAGIGGRSGNLRGEIRPGGNPFEGRREAEYPQPPPLEHPAQAVFREAAERIGHHPYPVPSATLAEPYVNPDGIERQACTYCGFCTGYRCEIGAKADSTVTVLPVAEASGRFELRPDSQVHRIVHEGRRARGVLYWDRDGRLHEQPAEIVVLTAYSLSNARLMLLSGVGTPYDPGSGTGVVGRNYALNFVHNTHAFFAERKFETYVGSGAGGSVIGDFNCDNFDHAGLDFLGGGIVFALTGGVGPLAGLQTPDGTPDWGAGWKGSLRRWYDRGVPITAHGIGMPYARHFLDLDPTYRDAWGDPLLRITFDWGPNERSLYRFLLERTEEIVREMGPDAVASPPERLGEFDARTYMSTHNTGGAAMGADPSSSAVNPWLQSWDVDNLWVVGGSAMPHAPGVGPTGTVCALAYRAATGIIERYRRSPGQIA
jgi:gluconate 2-dehydrogenase alpha chain